MITISKQEPVLARVLSKKARKGITALLLGWLLGAAPLAWADVTVALTAPPDQSTYTAPATITLEATADATQGFKVEKVEFFHNGTNLIGTDTSSPYSVDWTSVPAGAYVLTAKATAVKKNQPDQIATSSPVSVTVNAPNMPPTVSLTAPTEGATYNAPATITLTAVASDPDGSVTRVEFFHGGTNLIATITTPPYTFNWTNVEAGAYALTAKATDNLNATTTSTPVNVTVNATAALYFVHTDHLNTPRAITNQTGQLVWAWANDDPFGANVPNENPSGLGNFSCNLRLPGQYFDQETNNHYNMARDYDPAVGRYVQSDPLGVITTSGPTPTTRLNHLFAYVDNNPLSWIDPLGLVKWFGQSKSFNWLAYGRDEYELESECKCGVKARIKVLVDSLGPGFGASSTRSASEFEDHFACPNPMAFAGPAATFSGTIAVRFGTSYTRAQLGAARSTGGWSAVEGIGASIGFNFGNARVPVEDIRFETCPCEKK